MSLYDDIVEDNGFEEAVKEYEVEEKKEADFVVKPFKKNEDDNQHFKAPEKPSRKGRKQVPIYIPEDLLNEIKEQEVSAQTALTALVCFGWQYVKDKNLVLHVDTK